MANERLYSSKMLIGALYQSELGRELGGLGFGIEETHADTREATVCHDLDALQDLHHWPGLQAVGKVTATRETKGAIPEPGDRASPALSVGTAPAGTAPGDGSFQPGNRNPCPSPWSLNPAADPGMECRRSRFDAASCSSPHVAWKMRTGWIGGMSERTPFRLPEDGTDKVRLLSRLLETIENDILPLTARGVAAGNKIFGAALLRKSDLSLVLAETNNELANPLWHGEIQCLKSFFELVKRPATEELLFLSTHEPCSLCLSAITWAGFDNFFYLFSHADSRDAFAIPHDLRILGEVFGLEGGEYARRNAYWSCWSIMEEINRLGDAGRAPLLERADRIGRVYRELSEAYQETKGASAIPLR